MKLIIERTDPTVVMPSKAYTTSSGFDLRAWKFNTHYSTTQDYHYPNSSYVTSLDVSTSEYIDLAPLDRIIIDTGIKARMIDDALPPNYVYELQVRGRSGHGAKKGLTITNGIGTIDYEFSGSLGVIITNIGNEMQTITLGERIAQMVPVLVALPEIEEGTVGDLDRGANGFNSSGTH